MPRSGAPGRIRTAARWIASAAGKVLSPHKASLLRLTDIPLTVAGAGCIDAAAFAGNLIAGLVVTGITLILIEHAIADDDEPGRM